MTNRNYALLVSYESGDFASCPAEWADDKSIALQELGFHVILVTSPASAATSIAGKTVFKVPSLSHHDFQSELVRIRARNERIPLLLRLFAILPLTLGRLFDFLFSKLAGNLGWGRYSWVLTATPVITVLRLMRRGKVFIATGGPTSGPFSAVLAGLLTLEKPTLEFQDPIVGSQMLMSKLALRTLSGLEKFLILNSRTSVFVTESAARDALLRVPAADRIVQAIYPGSRDFSIPEVLKGVSEPPDQLKFVHLGSLYGTRNLDLLFQALDELYASNPECKGRFLITNIGNLSVENKTEYEIRDDFVSTMPLPRIMALEKAAEADFLLLIQHSDSRSEMTIPYKTYDYLNLSIPILGVLRNPELERIIRDAGGVVFSGSEASSLKKTLLELANPFSAAKKSRPDSSIKVIEIRQQLLKMLGASR